MKEYLIESMKDGREWRGDCYTSAAREPQAMVATVFEFGEFRLDCDRFELSRRGRTLKLERKPLELLILLAAKNGHLVTRTEIAERLWEREVFVDTEHGINTAVRKIRAVLNDDPEQPRFVQTVPGKGYRFVGEIEPVNQNAGMGNGFSPGAVPHSIKEGVTSEAAVVDEALPDREAEAGRFSGPATGGRSRRAIWVAVAGLAILIMLAGAVSWRAWRTREQSRELAIRSVAVIPLDNLSGDRGQDYFVDGMTDELITMLAKNSTLRVVSRTSVMQYKGVHRPLREIAQALGVDGILEGSVARSGEKVHLNVQLVHAPSDTHVWAESYDRDANDAFSLPRDAAVAIATKLKSETPGPAPRYVNPAAHDAYLRGKALWFSSRDGESGAYFEKAVQLQPDYSLGWSGLSKYYGDMSLGGQKAPGECLEQGEAAAKKAVELDDSSGEAHFALAASIWMNEWNWARALQESARAIELEPGNGEAYIARALILISLNRNQEAIETVKKAMEVDPFARPYALAMWYVATRQFDEAIAEANERLESMPNDDGLHWQLATAYESMGMYKEEEAAAMQAAALGGDQAEAARFHRAYLKGGHTALLRLKLRDAEAAALKNYVPPFQLADLHAKLGNREQALAFLEAAYRERSPMLLWVQTYPELDFLHGEERYRAIIKGIGLPPAY